MLSILVTGAAGLIGGEVCARLVSAGHKVVGLTRKTPDVLGNDGKPVALAGVLKGDVCEAGLALADAPHFDVIVHCAASLTFDAPYEELEAINVRGTGNVIALAHAHGAALLHVSTAYVCGLRDGSIGETPCAPGTVFANSYERSKAEAEALVQASGLAWCIARPAIVLGDSATGAIRKFDAMYQTFALVARGLVRELPCTADASLDFVPLDHVASSIACLAGRMGAASGHICHLTSGNPLPLAQFAQAIAAYPQFHAPQLVPADSFDPESLPPVQRRVWRKVASAYASYFQRNPLFDDSNARALTGLVPPDTGTVWLYRLIAFAIAEGLLPDAVPSARPDTIRPAVALRR